MFPEIEAFYDLDFVQFCYWGLGIMDAKTGSDRVSITAKSVLYR
jgi:hypothetical protein